MVIAVRPTDHPCAGSLVTRICAAALMLAAAATPAFANDDLHRRATSWGYPFRQAERGDAAAQTTLGHMYATGRGVPQDYVEAGAWYRRAADQGFPAAQFFLGLLYDKGFGVKQDWVEAEVWLALAAAHAAPRHRDFWAHVRDNVAGKLTLAEIAQAQGRALAFEPILERY